MKEYMIYGGVEDESPNVSIFFIGDLAETKIVYKKLERLCDLSYPETKSLKKEQEALIFDLRVAHCVKIWNDEDDKVDFTLHLAEFTELEIGDLK